MDENKKELADLKFYTVAEVEKILCVSNKTVHRYIDSGKLKATKIGGRWRILDEDLRIFALGTLR